MKTTKTRVRRRIGADARHRLKLAMQASGWHYQDRAAAAAAYLERRRKAKTAQALACCATVAAVLLLIVLAPSMAVQLLTIVAP